MTTELFKTRIATEAAFQADDMNLVKMEASDAAFAAYMNALAAARAEWNALPAGGAKDSAEINAFDTEGTDIDELHWFEIAIGGYELLT